MQNINAYIRFAFLRSEGEAQKEMIINYKDQYIGEYA